jgi:hypothetical protein
LVVVEDAEGDGFVELGPTFEDPRRLLEGGIVVDMDGVGVYPDSPC